MDRLTILAFGIIVLSFAFILKMPAQSLPKIANRILTVVRPLLGSIILLVFFD